MAEPTSRATNSTTPRGTVEAIRQLAADLDRADMIASASFEERFILGLPMSDGLRAPKPDGSSARSHLADRKYADLVAGLDGTQNWLEGLISQVDTYNLCTRFGCSTCGGGPFQLLMTELAGRAVGLPRPERVRHYGQWKVLDEYFNIPRVAREIGRQLGRTDLNTCRRGDAVDYILNVMAHAGLSETAREVFCAGFAGTEVDARWAEVSATQSATRHDRSDRAIHAAWLPECGDLSDAQPEQEREVTPSGSSETPSAGPTPLQDRALSSQAIMAADKARANLRMLDAMMPATGEPTARKPPDPRLADPETDHPCARSASEEELFAYSTGQIWTLDLKTDAADPHALEQTKADWRILSNWLGVVAEDLTPQCLRRAGHGFCGYLVNGVAPSSELRSHFDRARTMAMREGWTTITPPAHIEPALGRMMVATGMTRATTLGPAIVRRT